MVATVATLRWLTTPRLAWSFAAVAEAERWAPMFEAIRFPRTAEADFVVGGHCYGTFGHDWRADPVEGWIATKTALDAEARPSGEAGRPPPPLEVLSRPDFEAAVRQALRDYHRPALASNPLLRSRLLVEQSGGAPSAASLRTLIDRSVAELGGAPRAQKLRRALVCTYVEPAATQELAAERLGLPFNTYRYQLAAAIRQVVERLWQRELGADVG
jgi:hypothetical protein